MGVQKFECVKNTELSREQELGLKSIKLKLVKYTEIISSVPPPKKPVQKGHAQVDCTTSGMDASGKIFSIPESLFLKKVKT